MITPKDIVAGKSYSCTFTVPCLPLDEFGRPGGMLSMADLPIARVDDYTSTGDIIARDLEQELFQVQDSKSNRKFVVEFKDVTDIQEATDDDVCN
jgi:hypothetical protein